MVEKLPYQAVGRNKVDPPVSPRNVHDPRPARLQDRSINTNLSAFHPLITPSLVVRFLANSAPHNTKPAPWLQDSQPPPLSPPSPRPSPAPSPAHHNASPNPPRSASPSSTAPSHPTHTAHLRGTSSPTSVFTECKRSVSATWFLSATR